MSICPSKTLDMKSADLLKKILERSGTAAISDVTIKLAHRIYNLFGSQQETL
jgi:hypothetical protein